MVRKMSLLNVNIKGLEDTKQIDIDDTTLQEEGAIAFTDVDDGVMLVRLEGHYFEGRKSINIASDNLYVITENQRGYKYGFKNIKNLVIDKDELRNKGLIHFDYKGKRIKVDIRKFVNVSIRSM